MTKTILKKKLKYSTNKFKINTDLEIDLTILSKVFYPTHTSNLLINSCLKKIKKPSKILDIGCGSGIVGISLSNMGKTSAPVHFSDIPSTDIFILKCYKYVLCRACMHVHLSTKAQH